MKNRFIEWCISKWGIITIVTTVITALTLLTLTLTGITTWTQIGWITVKIIMILAGIFYNLFILCVAIGLILLLVYGVIKLYECYKKRHNCKTAEKQK